MYNKVYYNKCLFYMYILKEILCTFYTVLNNYVIYCVKRARAFARMENIFIIILLSLVNEKLV